MLPGMLLSARPSTFGSGEEARIYYYMKIAITIIIFIVAFHEDVMQSLLIKERKFRKYIKSVMSSNTIETLHAAVRFYSDERRKILIVPISDIEHFDREKCTNQPYYIKRHSNDDEHNFLFSPGEVLCVGSKEDLLNQGRRYKFSKIRRSDALQQLQMKLIETDGTSKQKNKITKKTWQKCEKMKNGQNELKKFLKNRKSLCTKNTSNKDTDLSNVSSPEPSTSCNTHNTSDTDSHSTSDTDSEVEGSKNQQAGGS